MSENHPFDIPGELKMNLFVYGRKGSFRKNALNFYLAETFYEIQLDLDIREPLIVTKLFPYIEIPLYKSSLYRGPTV